MSAQVLPKLPGLQWDTPKRPMWKTKIQEAESGRELRIKRMSQPKYYFSLNLDFLRARRELSELQTLMGFVNQMGGSFDSWLYQDPDDSYAQNEQIGTGNGVQVLFQLSRSYGGSRQIVHEPDLATLTFAATMWNYQDDPPMWAADGSTPMWGADQGSFTYLGKGLIQFNSPPPAGQPVLWSGGFYFRCRFLKDGYEFVQFAKKLWRVGTLDFVGSLSSQI